MSLIEAIALLDHTTRYAGEPPIVTSLWRPQAFGQRRLPTVARLVASPRFPDPCLWASGWPDLNRHATRCGRSPRTQGIASQFPTGFHAQPAFSPPPRKSALRAG